MKINKKTRNDIILIGIIILIASAALLFFTANKKEGSTVVVKIDGVQTGSYLLSENITVDIRTGENDEFLNTLVIENGKAYISQANCPDKICQEYRPVSYTGETIVCLPHKIIIEITAKQSVPGLDAVA